VSNREIELKFTLTEAGAAALAKALKLTRAKGRALTAVYYDTAGRDLRRAGFSLRVRQKGEVFIQTTKGPDGALDGGGFARGEWETPAKGFAIDRAALAATPAGAVAHGEVVAPVFAIRVQRRAVEVDEGSSRIEVSLDEGEAEAQGARSPIRELELELVGGRTGGKAGGQVADLFALARRLLPLAQMTLGFTSKADRGFALADGEGARAARPDDLRPGQSVGEAFRAIAHAALAQAALAGEVLAERDDAEAVHRMRVGLRRLRSAFSTFRKASADGRRDRVKAELKWLSGVMDRARDLDVFIAETFQTGRGALDADGQAALLARLEAARAKAYAAARKALATDRYRTLLLETAAWLEAGPWLRAPKVQHRDEPVGAFAARIMGRRLKAILKKGAGLAALTPPDRHKLRIAVKKLRYDADACAGLYGHPKRARRFIEAVRALQDALGQLNDLAAGGVLAATLVRGGPRDGQSTAAFAAGEIVGAAHVREPALIKAAEAAVADLKETGPFWR
jgi:inorganic triphosphatase YgiF